MMVLFDSQGAAKYLGVTRCRIRQLCQEGRLGRKVGRQWIMEADELERFKKIKRVAGNPNWIPRPNGGSK